LEGCHSLGAVLETLREEGRAIAGADGVAIVRREGDEVAYVGEDAIAPLWTGKRFAIRTCVSGMAILQREPVFVPDILADDRVPLNAYLSTFVRSMAVFPIGAGEPVAALGCYWAEARSIHADAARLIEMLTGAANTALERLAIADERL
jgi:GAF domain-containing protein